MSRVYDVALRINGELGNLQNAVNSAQRSLRNLGNSARTSSATASRATQNLQSRLNALQQNLNSTRQFQNLNAGIRNFSRETAQANLQARQLQSQLQQQERLTERMRQNFSRLQDARTSNRSSISSATVTNARRELRAQEQSLNQLRTQYQSAQRTADSLTQNLNAQVSTLNNLRSAFQNAGVGANNLASHERNLQSQIQQTSSQLQRQQNFDSARDRMNARSQNLSYAAGNFSGAIDTAKTILSPFTDAIKSYAKFDATMSKVRAVTGVTGQDFAELKAKAQELGRTTQFSANEVAEGMVKIGQAGWDKAKIIGGMQSMINLSIAGDASFETTADIVTDAMTAMGYTAGTTVVDGMGKSVEATQHFADVMAVAASKSNTDIPKMGQTFKYAAAAAGTLGYSIDDLALATGLMANAGIKDSMAGTALRSVFTRMATETGPTAQAMNMLGISLTEIDPTTGAEKMKSFTNVIKDMRGAFQKLDPEDLATKMEALSGEKMKNKDEIVGMLQKIKENGGELSKLDQIKFANMLAGQEALSGFLALITGSEQDFNTLVESIEKSNGAAKTMADIMGDNLEGDLKKLASAQEAASHSFAQAFEPAERAVTQFATNAVQGFSEWLTQNQTAVQWAGILAAGLAGILVAAAGVQLAFAGWGFISGALGMASAAVTAFSARLAACAAVQRVVTVATSAWAAVQGVLNGLLFANPIGLVVAGIAALVGVIYLAYTHIDELKNRWETLKSALSHPIEAVINFMDHGDVVGGNVKSGEQIAAAQSSGGGNFSAPAQNLDTSQAQAQVNELGNASNQAATSTQNFATNVETNATAAQSLNQNISAIGEGATSLQQNLSTVGTEFTNIQTGTQGVSTELTNLQTNAQAVSPELMNFQTNLSATSPQVTQLGTDSQTAAGGIQTLAQAASQTAGSLSQIDSAASQVASALSSKAAEISSIHISVPQVSTVPVAANAEGGIYKHGAFLTTFAEKSPEAAIPLDKSNRAKELWTQAGQILGMLPGENSATFENGEDNFSFSDKVKLPENISGKNSIPAKNVSRETISKKNSELGTALNFFESSNSGGENVSRETKSAPQMPINITISISGNADEQVMRSAGIEIAFELERKLDTWWKQKVHDEQRTNFQ